jgi:putative transposase
MDIDKAYKYRFYPTKEQEEILARTFGCARKVYNDGLALRTRIYTENKENVSYGQLAFLLTLSKAKEETSYLCEVSSIVLQQSLRNLETAYQNFFKWKMGFPKFKSKHARQLARYTKQGFTYDGRFSLKLAKMKDPLDIRWSRTIPRAAAEKASSVTVSKDKAGRYFVSILCLDSVEPKPRLETRIGLDLGLHDFITTSNGDKVASPRFYRKAEEKLSSLQRNHSRKQKGSKNREKSRIKLARAYAKVTNVRTDFLHKLSTKLINENQVICIESLAVRNMSRNHRLAKSIMDAGWGEFTRQLEYKAKWYGRDLVRVGRFFPSSKTCSHCGTIKPHLDLSERVWTCSDCGSEHDRDVNAALNVLAEGTSVLACGEESSGLASVQTVDETIFVEAGISSR